jgi:hypothetical protein
MSITRFSSFTTERERATHLALPTESKSSTGGAAELGRAVAPATTAIHVTTHFNIQPSGAFLAREKKFEMVSPHCSKQGRLNNEKICKHWLMNDLILQEQSIYCTN